MAARRGGDGEGRPRRCEQTVRPDDGAGGRVAVGRRRRVLHAGRPFRVWEDDDPATARGLRGADGGDGSLRRRVDGRRAAGGPRRRLGVSELRALSPHDCRGERRLRTPIRRPAGRRHDRGANRRPAGAGRIGGLRGPRPDGTLRGPTAARRIGAGAGARSRTPVARRADERTRRPPPGAAPPGRPRDSTGTRGHDRLRHPRPGRGARRLRPRGGALRGPRRTGRPTTGAVPPTGLAVRRGVPRREQRLRRAGRWHDPW